MPTRTDPIQTMPRSMVTEYFKNKQARAKFTFRITPDGCYYLIGGEMVPENDVIEMFPLDLRYSPENPDKTKF